MGLAILPSVGWQNEGAQRSLVDPATLAFGVGWGGRSSSCLSTGV